MNRPAIVSKFLLLALLTVSLSLKATTSEAQLLSSYLPVHSALSGDDISTARTRAEGLKSAAENLLTDLGSSHPQKANVTSILSGADTLAKSQSDEEARSAFGPIAKGLVEYIRQTPALQPQWQLFFCSMTQPYGYWVQPVGQKITNPYWGSEMLHCGAKKKW